MFSWDYKGGLTYSVAPHLLEGVFLSDDVDAAALSSLVTRLVRRQCFHDVPLADAFPLGHDASACAHALEELSIASISVHDESHVIRLTEHAFTKGLLVSGLELSNPQRALRVRPDVPLEDRSSLELMEMLHDDGWQWLPWIPPSSRRKCHRHLPVAYRAGDRKLYFATPFSVAPPLTEYLARLVRAAEIVERVGHVPHGREIKAEGVGSGKRSPGSPSAPCSELSSISVLPQPSVPTSPPRPTVALLGGGGSSSPSSSSDGRPSPRPPPRLAPPLRFSVACCMGRWAGRGESDPRPLSS